LARAICGLKGAAWGRALDPFATGAALEALDQPEADTQAVAVYHAAWTDGRCATASLRAPLRRLLARRCRAALDALLTPLLRPLALDPLRQADDPPSWTSALIDLWAARGDEAPLWAVVAEGGALGRRALAALGGCAQAAAPLIEAATQLQAEDLPPSTVAEALKAALSAAHRRGIFARPPDLAALVAIWIEDPAWSGRDLADLCFTARAALPEALSAALARRPLATPRVLEALIACPGDAAEAALEALAAATLADAVAEAMIPPTSATTTASRALILAALATRRTPHAEALLLEGLSICPEACLEGLARVGGAAAQAVIEARLDALPTAEALAALWALIPSEDHARREALLARLNPLKLPPRLVADLSEARAPAFIQMRRRVAATQRPDKALITLSALGEEADLARISALLVEVCLGLDSGAVPPDVGGPQLVIPERVIAALAGYARRLAGRGRVGIAAIQLGDDPEASFMSWIGLGALEDPRISVGARRALVEVVAADGCPWARRALARLLRDKEPVVQAAAARGLVALEAHALGFSLARLLAHPASGVVTAALEAVGAFHLSTPAVAALLRHPKMNVKKAAAEALARLSPAHALPEIVAALARWENPGLRAALLAAYDASGAGVGPLLAALYEADPEDEGAHTRLIAALDKRLRPEGVEALALAEGAPAWAVEAILAAIDEGRLSLAEGDGLGLRARLRRAGRPQPSAPTLSPSARLLRWGWDEADALAALAEAPPWDLLARFTPELLALMPRLEGAALAHLALALARVARLDEAAAALPHLVEALRRLQPQPAAEGLLVLMARLAPRLAPPTAMWLLAVIRALPPSPGGGLARWRAVAALTDQLSLADLRAALADCDLQATPAARRALLAVAFNVEIKAAPVDPRWLERLDDVGEGQLSALLAATEHAAADRAVAALAHAATLRPLGLAPLKARAVKAVKPPRPLAAWLAALASPSEAGAAAMWLLTHSEEDQIRRAVMAAYLDGLALDGLALDGAALRRLAWSLSVEDLHAPRGLALAPYLSSDALRGLARADLPPDAWGLLPLDALLAEVVRRLEGGDRGLVGALAQRALPDSPLLQRALALAATRGADVAAWEVTPGAFSPAAPYAPPVPPRPPVARDPAARRAQLHAEALGADSARARAALAALAAHGWGDEALYLALLEGRDRGRRLAALRGLAACASPTVYLRAILRCLEDERRVEVEVGLTRRLAQAVIPAEVAAEVARALARRLGHAHPKIHEAATQGLRRGGPAALHALHQAARHARPDQRARYTTLIEAIEGA
ncbi:hypothetical protein KKF91_16110, partial [Myxococcota bacterium]|nr:hypothetical protein [Myxococcota bacterium]